MGLEQRCLVDSLGLNNGARWALPIRGQTLPSTLRGGTGQCLSRATAVGGYTESTFLLCFLLFQPLWKSRETSPCPDPLWVCWEAGSAHRLLLETTKPFLGLLDAVKGAKGPREMFPPAQWCHPRGSAGPERRGAGWHLWGAAARSERGVEQGCSLLPSISARSPWAGQEEPRSPKSCCSRRWGVGQSSQVVTADA